MIKKSFMLALLLSGLAINTAAADEGIIVRSSALKKSPSFSSRTLKPLSPGTNVMLKKRKGGWQEIVVLPKQDPKGWVRTYQVRTHLKTEQLVITKRDKNSGNVVSGLAGLSRKTANLFGRRENARQGNSNVAATIGIRGLSESDLKNAKANPEELEKLKKYRVSKSAAQKFAALGGLKSQKVKELPKPKKKK